MVNHATTGGKSFGYAQQRRASSDLANRHSYLVMTAGSAQWKTANPVHEVDEVDAVDVVDAVHESDVAHDDSRVTQVIGAGATSSDAAVETVELSVDKDDRVATAMGILTSNGDDMPAGELNSASNSDSVANGTDYATNQVNTGQHLEPVQTASSSTEHAEIAQKEEPSKQQVQNAQDNQPSKPKTHAEPKQEEKPSKKQVKAVLKAAAVNMSARKFEKMWKRRNEDVGISEVGCFEASGCYAFLRYETGSKKATDFADVYVGGSPTMGASIMRHLEGNGNPDVYADVKYRQNVRVLLFPYPQEMLRVKSRQLMDVLGADVSYNARNHR